MEFCELFRLLFSCMKCLYVIFNPVNIQLRSLIRKRYNDSRLYCHERIGHEIFILSFSFKLKNHTHATQSAYSFTIYTMTF